MKAYGDFNNDLLYILCYIRSTDFVVVNEEKEILIFVWNSDTYLYDKVWGKKMVEEYLPKTLYLVDIHLKMSQ